MAHNESSSSGLTNHKAFMGVVAEYSLYDITGAFPLNSYLLRKLPIKKPLANKLSEIKSGWNVRNYL